MEVALWAGGDGFLEQLDGLLGLVADEFQGGEAPGRPHVEMLSAARGYDKAFGCVHDVPPLWRSRLIRDPAAGVTRQAAARPRLGHRCRLELRRAACGDGPQPPIPHEPDRL